MAKKRSRSHPITPTPRRDALSGVARSANYWPDLLAGPALTRSSRLIAVEDRRTFHPLVSRPPRTLSNRRSLLILSAIAERDRKRSVTPRASRSANFFQTRAPLAFKVPGVVAVCVRRRQRRQVLFAKGVGGSRGLNRPRRNFWSSVSCGRR